MRLPPPVIPIPRSAQWPDLPRHPWWWFARKRLDRWGFVTWTSSEWWDYHRGSLEDGLARLLIRFGLRMVPPGGWYWPHRLPPGVGLGEAGRWTWPWRAR